jgi:hypothetical protein
MCKSESVSHLCFLHRHVSGHCPAQWKEIHLATKSKGPPFGNNPNIHQASTSKIPFVKPEVDSLPFSNALPSPPETELHLVLHCKTSTQSPTHLVVQATLAASVFHLHPSSSANPSSGVMVFQRADPRPFAPRGFDTMEI